MALEEDSERIVSLTSQLTAVARSSSSAARKGGLLCLAAVTVGLAASGSPLSQDADFVTSHVTPAIFDVRKCALSV